MELNIPPQERERVIGDLSRRLLDSIPAEKRKGYLFQPKQALTLPGMIDMILDAEGITAEMREAQREKMRVMEMFLQVGEDQWPRLVEENDATIDLEFFQMVLIIAENAAQTGRRTWPKGYPAVQLPGAEHRIGQQAMQTAQVGEVIRAVAEDVQRLGRENLSREAFMDLVLDTWATKPRAGARRADAARVHYTFFQELTARSSRRRAMSAGLANLRASLLR